MRSKFLLEAVSEALSLNGVGSATGVDAAATLGLAVVDLSGLQPDLACNERVVRVAVSGVIAFCVEDTAEVRSPSDDEVYLMPVAGPRVSPRHFVQLLTLKVAVLDAEAVVTAEFEQPLPILIHPADPEVAKAGRPCLPVVPNASVEICPRNLGFRIVFPVEPRRIAPWLLGWRSASGPRRI